ECLHGSVHRDHEVETPNPFRSRSGQAPNRCCMLGHTLKMIRLTV
ncbi:hypothetical protein NPIL_567871, partial [Nephila pilipes]